MDKIIIGKRVRKHRESLELSRDQFAERIEISPQFLAEIENGKKGMSAETLYKLCDKGQASADYILFGRQTATDIKTPAINTLLKIPSEYSEQVEELLLNLLKTIEKANSKKA